MTTCSPDGRVVFDAPFRGRMNGATVAGQKVYRIPKELDLSRIVGEFTTQVRVGQFDLQFTFGSVNFAIQSSVSLFLEGKPVGYWQEGRWPDPSFYDIMNTKVSRCTIVNDKLIEIEFESGLTMHLEDNSDQYESMQITIDGDLSPWII